MKPAGAIFILLVIVAVAALVRCWFRPDPHYVGWVLLAFFSLLGSVAAI